MYIMLKMVYNQMGKATGFGNIFLIIFATKSYQNRLLKNFGEGMLMRGTRTGATIAL